MCDTFLEWKPVNIKKCLVWAFSVFIIELLLIIVTFWHYQACNPAAGILQFTSVLFLTFWGNLDLTVATRSLSLQDNNLEENHKVAGSLGKDMKEEFLKPFSFILGRIKSQMVKGLEVRKPELNGRIMEQCLTQREAKNISVILFL